MTKFGESSAVVSIFTEEFGLQSYMVNGVRSKGSKSRIALYQPLTLLDLVVYHREHANLNRIKEVRCLYAYQHIHTDIAKSSIALFIGEVLNRSVKEESHAAELCQFITASLVTLDQLESGVNDFHLFFLVKLSRYLGFGARHVNEILGGRITEPLNEAAITNMLENDYAFDLKLDTGRRRELLGLLLAFYEEHIGMGELKSTQVLREVLM